MLRKVIPDMEELFAFSLWPGLRFAEKIGRETGVSHVARRINRFALRATLLLFTSTSKPFIAPLCLIEC